MLSYDAVKREMLSLYAEGNRILFFCGGETFLWRDGEQCLADLVREAKRIGFYLVNIVTNGLHDLHIDGADVVFLSLDGTRESHNAIRGESFDAILSNVRKTKNMNICVYMAINAINYRDISALADIVKEEPALRSISFNFHTPYAGTEYLSLSDEQKKEAVDTIIKLVDDGYPVFNLKTGLRHYRSGCWTRPSHQCLVSEKGVRFVCGRCVAVPGLCSKCGYLFAVEFSLLFSGHIPAIVEMLKTYRHFAQC